MSQGFYSTSLVIFAFLFCSFRKAQAYRVTNPNNPMLRQQQRQLLRQYRLDLVCEFEPIYALDDPREVDALMKDRACM